VSRPAVGATAASTWDRANVSERPIRRVRRSLANRAGKSLEEPQRLTAGAGRKACLVALTGNVDDVHRAVALAAHE
jgi:hypothetical protein